MGRFGVYCCDLTSGSIGEPVFEHPEVDIAGVRANRWTGEVDGVVY